MQHSLLLREIKGFEPTHLTKSGDRISSIPFYSDELEKLNNEISDTITKITVAKEEERQRFMMKLGESRTTLSTGMMDEGEDTIGKPTEEIHFSPHHDEHKRAISDLPTHLSSRLLNNVGDSSQTLLRTTDNQDIITPTDNQGIITSANENNTLGSESPLFAPEQDETNSFLPNHSRGHSDQLLLKSEHGVENDDSCQLMNLDDNGDHDDRTEQHKDKINYSLLPSQIQKDRSGRSLYSTIHGGVKKSALIVHQGMKKTASKTVSVAQDGVKKSVFGMIHMGTKSVQLATDLIRGSDDGRVSELIMYLSSETISFFLTNNVFRFCITSIKGTVAS